MSGDSVFPSVAACEEVERRRLAVPDWVRFGANFEQLSGESLDSALARQRKAAAEREVARLIRQAERADERARVESDAQRAGVQA